MQPTQRLHAPTSAWVLPARCNAGVPGPGSSMRQRCRARCQASTQQHEGAQAATPQQQQHQAALQPVSFTQEQMAQLKQLQQQAYEAGFSRGYQQGVRVQVSVAVDLDPSSSSSTTTSSSSSSSSGRSPMASQLLGAARVSRSGQGPPPAHQQPQQQAQQPQQPQVDSIGRSAVKGLVWRVFSTSATVSVALLVLHDSLAMSDALRFGGIEFCTKYVLYVLHERLWAAAALL